MSGAEYQKEIFRLKVQISQAKAQRSAAIRTAADASWKKASDLLSTLVPQMRDRYAD